MKNISVDYTQSRGIQLQTFSLSGSVYDARYLLTSSFSGALYGIGDGRYLLTSSFSGALYGIGDGRYVLTGSSQQQRISSSLVLSGNLTGVGTGSFLSFGVGTTSSLGLVEFKAAGQPQMYWTDSTGGSNNKSGRIVFDGGVGLSAPGWVFQDVNDAGTFQANRITLARAGKIGIGAGALNPSASLEVSGNAKIAWLGYNGANGYGDYGLWVSCTGSNTVQNTLGVESHGDMYNNLNLWSNVSGNRRGWHISKRLQTEGNILQFYYYDAGSFTSVLTLSGNQRIGINTATPNAALDINGNNTDTMIAISTAGAANAGNAILSLTTDGNQNYRVLGRRNTNCLELSSALGTIHLQASTGYVGTRTVPTSPLDVFHAAAGPISQFFNDGNTTANWGIMVQCGEDSPSGTNVFFEAREGDGAATGRLQTTGAGTFALADVSDERVKVNIQPSTVEALKLIKAIETIEYARAKGEHIYDKNDIGFSAQNCKEVFPQMVSEDENGLLMTLRSELIPVLVKAIKELVARVEFLEGK